MTATALARPTNIAPLKGRNIIAVASGKGGVGKTFFSITLTHALSRMGRSSLLFDGDLGLANVDIQLGLMPKRDIGSVVDKRTSLQSAVETFRDGGFDVVAGRSGSGNLANLTVQRLNELRGDIEDVATSYDTVVIDLGAGVDRTVRQLSFNAGLTLVVTTDEPTSLTDAYAFIKVAHATNPGADLRVVVNMTSSMREGQRTYETIQKACQNFLKFSPPLAGIIRRDNKVRDAIRSQSPLLIRSPNCDAANDVRALAGKLFARA